MCPHTRVQMETWGRKLLGNDTARAMPRAGGCGNCSDVGSQVAVEKKIFHQGFEIAEPNAYCHIEWSTFSVIPFIILLINVNLKSQK